MPAVDHDAVDRRVEEITEPYTGLVRVTLRRTGRHASGYDPGLDALLIETCDSEWVLIAPWRYASGGEGIGHLPRDQALELLEPVRAWHYRVTGDDERGLRVWELWRGERELHGLSRTPDGWGV